MALSLERLRSIIESMLLVSSEPLVPARIVEVIAGEDSKTDPALVEKAIKQLVEAYGDPERKIGAGFRVEEVGGGLQLRSTAENADYVRRLLAARPQKLTKAALETLAIIAYRQPVTKPEVESIRGVDVGAVLKALLDREMIRILGKKEEVGRPIMYGTTQKFLELFGLKSLSALPTLREYHELDDEHQRQVDELYEPESRQTMLSDLAATAQFLMDREEDPDLDELDQAVAGAERAERAAESFLNQDRESAQKNAESEAGAEAERV